MSSYAQLTLGSLRLGVSRNRVDPELIWLFRPSNKYIDQLTRNDRDRLGVYVSEEAIEFYGDEHPFTYLEYRCSVKGLRDRLELKGFTLEMAKERFKAGLEYDIQNTDSSIKLRRLPEQLLSSYTEELRVLRSLTIEVWLNGVNRIREDHLTKDVLDFIPSHDEELPLLRYMLKFSDDLYGFPGPRWEDSKYDYLLFLRLITESSPPDDQIIYDLTPLIPGGWINVEDDSIALVEDDMDTTALFSQRVIILTEGTTDREFLKRSMKLLYPHLTDYFHFFDFDLNRNNRLGGGAGHLANLVRAFAGASVRHRILALFDNDTAAKEALRNFDSNLLPENIVLRYYPDLDIAENYPTVGPTGRETMNINGLAGGMELYLGREVLVDDTGELTPVQWTGYSRSVGTYQGEIMNKMDVQNRFREKLESCEGHPDQLERYDWEGVRAILDLVLTSFHSVDSHLISSSYHQLNLRP